MGQPVAFLLAATPLLLMQQHRSTLSISRHRLPVHWHKACYRTVAHTTGVPALSRPPRACMSPPNEEVDWVIVDVSVDGLNNPPAELISAAQDDAKSAVRAVLRDASAELSVVLASDEAIRGVNSRWRGVDDSTDVLAFPQDDPDRVVLGDIIVSVETAERQAVQAGIDTKDEIRILLLHGLLHLLGYDHVGAVEGDWLVMAQMENRFIKMLGWRGEGLVSAAQDPFYKDIIQA